MGTKTGISWTDSTWNPLTGCTQVSPGCANCYAKGLAEGMMQRVKSPRYANGFDLTLQPDLLDLPRRWKKPRMIFVNSMSDLFHKDVPLSYIQSVFEVMSQTPQHTYQLLTKRHERLERLAAGGLVKWTDNIWQGVSIENNRFVHRADYLRQVPARTRFISAEPLLGELTDLSLEGISWLIVGGESGPRHRPLNLEHARYLRDKCQREGVAFFFKQVGGTKPGSGGKELDGRTWDEMPTVPVAKSAKSEGVA